MFDSIMCIGRNSSGGHRAQRRVRFIPWLSCWRALRAFRAVGHSYEHYGTFRALFDVPSETALAVAALAAYVPCLYLALSLRFPGSMAHRCVAERIIAGERARFLRFGRRWHFAACLASVSGCIRSLFTYDGIFQMDMYGFAPPPTTIRGS
ncbi:MAG: hypothetical protein ACLT98_10765 [Eggerthellaceae bacterium]